MQMNVSSFKDNSIKRNISFSILSRTGRQTSAILDSLDHENI